MDYSAMSVEELKKRWKNARNVYRELRGFLPMDNDACVIVFEECMALAKELLKREGN
jgi:hypothetical protein